MASDLPEGSSHPEEEEDAEPKELPSHYKRTFSFRMIPEVRLVEADQLYYSYPYRLPVVAMTVQQSNRRNCLAIPQPPLQMVSGCEVTVLQGVTRRSPDWTYTPHHVSVRL